MSLGSNAYGKGRSAISRMTVTPRDTLPAFRPHQLYPLQIFVRHLRLLAIVHPQHSSYCILSKTNDAKLYHNGSSARSITPEKLRLTRLGHQLGSNLEKQCQSTLETNSKIPLVWTNADAERAASKHLRNQSSNTEQVDTMKKKRERYRDVKLDLNKQWKYKGAWSQDWRVPLELLEQHYEAEGKEQPSNGCVRAVWARTRGSISQIRADKIPKPLDWSVISFKDYVQDLTTSTVDRSIQRRIYSTKESHVMCIVDILEEIFLRTDFQRFFSAKACNIALDFFYKHNMFTKARALYTTMEDLHIEIQPETYHWVLLGAASDKDLRNYTYHLENLIERGLKPDSRTWVSLLMAVDSREARATIVEAMQERKLLDRFSIMRDVVNCTIRDEIATHLDNSNTMGTFFEDMDMRYPPGWLTVSGANNLLDEVSLRRSVREAFELLNEIEKRCHLLNNVSLNTLLTHCRDDKAHDLTIDVLDYFTVTQRIRPGQKHYEGLFTQAWRSRLYNFARVIWRSACVDAVVSFKMQKLVVDSLAAGIVDGADSQPKSKPEIWNTAAGEVIVGIDSIVVEDEKNDIRSPDTPMQDPAWKPKGLPIQPAPAADGTNPTRRTPRALRSATLLVEQDMATFGKLRLKSPLTTLLREALRMDRDWAERGLREAPTQWKRQNAIIVDMEVAGPTGLALVRKVEDSTRWTSYSVYKGKPDSPG